MTGTLHACPTHPEVQQPGPGSCPVCRAALVPHSRSALHAVTVRFWVCVALTLPTVALSLRHELPLPAIDGDHAAWLQLALATPVVLWGGWLFLARAGRGLAKGRFDLSLLVAVGVLAAYLPSAAAALVPARVPFGLLFDAAAVGVTLALLVHGLELRARAQAASALAGLLKLAPAAARLVQDGKDQQAATATLTPGVLVRVPAGERIPADGRVMDGHATVDESDVTGEAAAADKRAGDRVLAGTRVAQATVPLLVAVERVGTETLLHRVVARVAEAQRSRAAIQKAADRTAAVLVPLALAVAVLAAVGAMLWGPEPKPAHALAAAVAVLLAAAPGAIAWSASLPILVAAGRGAALGILFRDADALERLREVDTAVLDKTGTLTAGRMRLHAIYPGPGIDEREALRMAAAVERASSHPIAQALAGAALDAPQATGFRVVAGQGVVGFVEGRKVAVGHRFLVSDAGASVPLDAEANAASMRRLGLTVVYLAVDGELWGVLGLADTVKPSCRESVSHLRELHLQVRMLSGDNATTANAVASRAGIREVDAGVPPDAKADVIRRLQGEGRKVAMCGDGAQDAPALEAAHVGVAMGPDPEATKGAGITLVARDVGGLERAIRLARLASANIRQNLGLAIGYNALALLVAAGALQPFFGLAWPPVAAAVGAALASFVVVGNALRLHRSRLETP